MRRCAALGLALTLALLPWGVLPFPPGIHPHAQWSDIALALATAAWLLSGPRPALRPVHAALAAYLLAACGSWAASAAASSVKLAGTGSLVVLAVLTADLAPGCARLLGRALSVTSLGVGLAAALGVALFAAGIATPLVGAYGDLVPGPYARAQAGFSHPNLLASFCIFGVGAVASLETSPRWRRAATLALGVAVLLTLSRGILGFGVALLIRHAPRRVAGAGAVAALLIVAALTLFNVSLDPTRPADVHLAPGPSSRLESMATAWVTVRERPWTGSGPGVAPATREGLPWDAHCTPLDVAATLGVPALAAFLAIPVLLWRGRARPTDLSLWGSLAGLGIDALAQDVEDFRHVFALCGLLAAIPVAPAPGGGPRSSGRIPGAP